MLTFLIRYAVSQSSRYLTVLARLRGSRSRPNPFLKSRHADYSANMAVKRIAAAVAVAVVVGIVVIGVIVVEI